MNLEQSKKPQVYRLRYASDRRALVISVSSEIGYDLFARDYQQDNSLGTDQNARPDADIGAFEQSRESWGYGGCARVSDVVDTSGKWLEWSLSLRELLSRYKRDSPMYWRTYNDITRTLALILELLNTYKANDDQQSVSLATLVTSRALCGFPIVGCLSGDACQRLIRLFQDEDTRIALMRELFEHAMDPVFRFLMSDLDPAKDKRAISMSRYSITDGYVGVSFISGSWRICFECMGASMAITPQYDDPERSDALLHGAHLEPHNTDGPMQQLVIACGFARLCEILYRETGE